MYRIEGQPEPCLGIVRRDELESFRNRLIESLWIVPWSSGAVLSASVLNPGDGVVMDNLSSHKVDGVRESFEKVGAELLYLPPSSPDLNPLKRLGPSVVTFVLHQEGEQL
jgi:hypothetical protein